jgi:hypothetical protein
MAQAARETCWACHHTQRETLILMGDWCVAARPTLENPVRGEFDDWECSLEGGILRDKRVRACGAGVCACQLTGAANG